MNVTPARMRRGKDCLNPLERPPTVIKIGDDEYFADSSGVITLPNFQISIDDVLDEDSTNPVQNKVITLKIDDIIDSIDAIEDELGDAAIPGTVRGDIASVNDRVDAVEDEIGSESDPGSILYKIHGNENDISGIQTHLDTVDGVIAAHATAINDKADKTALNSHVADTNNPHNVTKAQVGLSNVDNTSDANKPISTATQSALDAKANAANTYNKTEVDNLINASIDYFCGNIPSNTQSSAVPLQNIRMSNRGRISYNTSTHVFTLQPGFYYVSITQVPTSNSNTVLSGFNLYVNGRTSYETATGSTIVYYSTATNVSLSSSGNVGLVYSSLTIIALK